METRYPTLKRPKRKLCYLTNKDRPSTQGVGMLSLTDVDKMFEDLDPPPHEDSCDPLPPSPLLHMSDTGSVTETSAVQPEGDLTEEPGCQMGPEGDVLHPATRSLSPELAIDSDVPFKAHRPVKTSSPIEEKMVVEGVEELDNEKVQRAVSPLLFASEDEEKEEAKTEPVPTQKPQCNGHITKEGSDCELETPPSKVVLGKPKTPSRKNKAEASCHPVKEKTTKRPKTPDVEVKRKPPSQENTDPPVSAARPEPEPAAPKTNSESVQRQPAAQVSKSRVGKGTSSFLQRLRDAGRPKAPCFQKSPSPVKVPTLPPVSDEDEFLILDDDVPFLFSIPKKNASSKRQRQNRTSSTDKDSSTDRQGSKDGPLETPPKKKESEKTNKKLGSQAVSQKAKKMKGKEKKNEVIESGHDEDLPVVNLTEQEKPNKKKRLKKAPPKESTEPEEQPAASRETGEENPAPKVEKKALKSTDTKRAKSLKDENENFKMGRAKSLKGGRKVTKSDAVKETEAVKEQSQGRKECSDEDPSSFSDREILISEARTMKEADGKDKGNKPPVVSEENSSEDSQVLLKRKRRQTGQWWLSVPQSTEEASVTDNQPTLKRSKQNNKESSPAVPSPAPTKKNRVLKRTQPKPSSQNTNKAKEKKTKRNKKTRGDTPDKMKPTCEVFNEIEEEQIEEQQQDLDTELSSPLVFAHREHSLNPGDPVFQRVYSHISNEKMSPAPVSRGSKEQLSASEPGKRRRRPPSTWWTVNDVSEDVESVSSQPQQQEPKPRKERKNMSKQSRSPRLGTPKNGNVSVSSKALKVAPLSAPKTIKRSLSTFKDIFTSVMETPTVVSIRDAGQKKRRKVTAQPAEEEVAATDHSKPEKHVLSMDAGESNQETPQDSNSMLALRSGPSSMIMLEQYDDDQDLILPTSRVQAALSVSDLCAPPLKPLILQPKDRANLTEWFKTLWSATVDNAPEITPDQFDWYFYRGRAIGFLEDLNSGSICSGKVLLGSYMKKPLWVDHNATTVFNVFTSSVSVTINGSESRFYLGQSFLVPCGHAHSIQNVTAQPAVLYFTRILAESSD